jgi:hypothetical protein
MMVLPTWVTNLVDVLSLKRGSKHDAEHFARRERDLQKRLDRLTRELEVVQRQQPAPNGEGS